MSAQNLFGPRSKCTKFDAVFVYCRLRKPAVFLACSPQYYEGLLVDYKKILITKLYIVVMFTPSLFRSSV